MKHDPIVEEIHLQKAYARKATETLVRSLLGAVPGVGTAIK